ncbi:glycosyltransferase [Pseudomarimonas salicorniae]|uniref:Glycosyltransferase family 2 protein n=1 Tax=Pseudomarimonas salicorniae TaxID=2933270 RepID=A0ABT0GJ85_9GAMM|nr:glycosyltransferase family 2 protein [Lysobacter sp. CAU 1642]
MSAVVVLHNSAATLAACLRAALAQPALVELMVVDNGSIDNWRGELPEDDRLRVLSNAGNPGFATACNQGAAASAGDVLLFLNPDCLLEPDSLGALLDVAAEQPGDGLLGAQLLEADGRPQPASRRLAPTPPRVLAGRIDLDQPEWQAAGRGPAPRFEPLEAISGALMLIPRCLFESVGGFDAGYRLHFEDLDLCRRVRDSGAWVGIAPRVRVRHLKGTSSRRRPFWVEWQKHRGLWRYYSKFDRPTAGAWTSLLLASLLAAHYPWAALRAWWRSRRAGGAPSGSPLT